MNAYFLLKIVHFLGLGLTFMGLSGVLALSIAGEATRVARSRGKCSTELFCHSSDFEFGPAPVCTGVDQWYETDLVVG